MHNWDIIDINTTGENNETENEDDLIRDIIAEFTNCSHKGNRLERTTKSRVEKINLIVNKVNKEKTGLISSFPSCPLGIIKNLTQTHSIDEDQMEVDQFSIFDSDVHNSNSSPMFDSQANIETNRTLSDSPGSANISAYT